MSAPAIPFKERDETEEAKSAAEQGIGDGTFVIDGLTEARQGRKAEELHCEEEAEMEEKANLAFPPELQEPLGGATFDLAASNNSQLSPHSPGSSLSKSLKFLEASHLLSDEEMIQMGCQPPSRNTTHLLPAEASTAGVGVPLELSSASSLLTESLLNASLDNDGHRVITSTCVKAQMSGQGRRIDRDSGEESDCINEGVPSEAGALFTDLCASPIHCDADHGDDSEIDNATFSLRSHDLESMADKSLEASLNESELCSESAPTGPPADMEVLDKLSERSLSEADLTMRDEEAEGSGSEANAVSLGGGLKKKRTRSPTPSSAKTESVPAKRSMTLQRNRPTPSTGRPLSTTAAGRRSSGQSASGGTAGRQSNVTASSSSLASKSGTSSTLASRRSAAAAVKKSSPAAPSGSASARPSSSGDSGPRRSFGGVSTRGPSAAQSQAGASARSQRRSAGGSTGDVSSADFKKPLARNSSAAARSVSAAPSRREKASTLGSLSARTSTDGAAHGKSSGSAAATSATPTSGTPSSRLKTPSLLQRTFSRKSTSQAGVGGTPSSQSSTPRNSTTPRSTQNAGTSVTNLNAASSAASARKKDSQLQPRSTGGKLTGRPTAGERNSASSSGKPQADGRLKVAPSFANVKGSGRQPLSSNSSDVKSSRCSSPEVDPLREQMSATISSQTAQLAAQEARLSELVLRCSEKDKALAESHARLQHVVNTFTVMATVCQTLQRHVEEADGRKVALEREIQEVMAQVQEVSSQYELLMQEKVALKQEMVKEAEVFRQKISELNTSHRVLLQNERTKLLTEKEEAITKFIDQHSAEVKTLKHYHEKEVQNQGEHADMRMKELKDDYEKRLYRNLKMHENEVIELQNQHEKKIAEITRRFEEMKVTLSNRIQVLHMECNELRSKTYEHDEHVRRNSDFKLQRSESASVYGTMSHSSTSLSFSAETLNGRFGLASSEAAIQQFQHLPEENASLKAVLDLRINENAELRRQNTELQAKISELEEIRIKNDQLIRQNENLEAIISLKTDNEKQLQERHQSLMRRYDRESKEKKRLSMGYEELLYKLEEHEDLTKRSLSDIPSMTSSAVVMRSTPPASRPRHRGLQHDRSKRKTIASSRELD